MDKPVHRTRFGVIVGLVAIALFIIYPPGKTLKQGIDLKGGYSVIYELDLKDVPADRHYQVTEDTISQLKKRVDPLGQRNLVWRQMGANRIEIQMPLPASDVSVKRNEFQKAQQAIEQNNINVSEVVRTLEDVSDPGQREEKLLALAGSNNEVRKNLLKQIAVAFDRYQAAKARPAPATQSASAPAGAGENAALAVASADLLKLYDQLRDTNVNLSALNRILDMSTAQKSGVEARQREIDGLKNTHPLVASQINAAVTSFDDWKQVKGPLDDLDDLKRVLKGAGALDFRILPGLSDVPDVQRYVDTLNEKGPKAFRNDLFCWIEIDKPTDFKEVGVQHVYGGKKYVLAYNTQGMTLIHFSGQNVSDKVQPWRLVRAYPMPNDQTGGYSVSFELDAAGGGQFYSLTSPNVGRPLCIILDGKAISAPNLQSGIRSSGQITGQFSDKEIKYLVDTLNAGTLKAQLKDSPIAERAVGSSLGDTNSRDGIRSVLIGFAVTLLFMVIYYYWAGAIANLALVLNLLFILAAMVMLTATFTLPGLAGLVLTLAMAVDANVLIYERIREEQERGLGIRKAIREGYARAFWTILDSNLTTVLTAGILYYFGSEDIRSFAVTLFWGLCISMFTALWVTRTIFDWAIDSGKLTHVKMLKLIGHGTIDWISLQPLFRTISGAVILTSLGIFVWASMSEKTRAKIFDIEFLGGTSVQVDFLTDKKVTDTTVREGIDDASKQLGGTWAEAVAKAEAAPIPGQPADVQLKSADTSVPPQTLANMIQAMLPSVVLNIDPQLIVRLDVEQAKKDAQAEGIPYGSAAEYLAKRLPLAANEMREAAKAFRDAGIQSVGEEGRSFEIITTVRKRDLVVQTILSEFGGQLEEKPPLKYVVKSDPNRARDNYFYPVDHRLLSGVIGEGPAEPVGNYLGGAAFVLNDITPPQPISVLRERVRAARLSPEFEHSTWREFDVVGLKSVGENKGQPLYSSVAVVVRDPNVDVVDNERDWLNMANEELKLTESALSSGKPLSKITTFDAQVAETAKRQGIISIILAFLGVSVYVWLRFGSINFGLGALVSVTHDVIVAVGVVCMLALLDVPGMKINLVVVGAFLTVIGYSINDTIVVFDRIRETRGRLTTLTPKLINDAINATLSRTLLTSTTVMLVLGVMLIFGGLGLRGFSTAMLIGVITGTYSSIAIAAPLLLIRWKREEKKAAAKMSSAAKLAKA